MKKILLLTAGLFLFFNVTAQETKFGLTAGYSDVTIKSTYEDINTSVNGSGFYLGALVDFSLSETFHIQPGVNYGNIEEANMLFIPVMAKYYLGNSDFNLQAGPQVTIILDEEDGRTNAFGLDIGFGAGYDITTNFFLEARYSLEVTNRVKFKFEGVPEQPKARFNTFTAGVGYKF